MTAVAQISVNDGETSPVAHAFDPAGILLDTANYENRISGILVGYELLSIRVVRTKNPNGYSRVVLKYVLPTLETTAGNTGSGIQAAPMVAFNDFVDITYRTHARSITQGRKNARLLSANLLGHAAVVAAWDKLEPIY